jgi:transposase InsO family protein
LGFAQKPISRYLIGYFHIDIAEVRTEEGKLYLFVAVDRTSKFAFAQLHEAAAVKTAAGFLEALIEAVPYKVHTVLTDNGVQFGDMPSRRAGPTARYRLHMFERICREHGIEHRLTKPNHPWTNGQVERMNRTLKEATVRRSLPVARREDVEFSRRLLRPFLHYDQRQLLQSRAAVLCHGARPGPYPVRGRLAVRRQRAGGAMDGNRPVMPRGHRHDPHHAQATCCKCLAMNTNFPDGLEVPGWEERGRMKALRFSDDN